MPKVTMSDKLLNLLGERYVTPLDALQTVQCFSLAQRVSEYIRRGLVIDKQPVKLDSGKTVMSYRLVK